MAGDVGMGFWCASFILNASSSMKTVVDSFSSVIHGSIHKR